MGSSGKTTVVQAPSAASQGLQYTPEQIEQVSQPFGLTAPTGGITWDYPNKMGYADISQMYRDIADPLFQRAKATQQALGAYDPAAAAQQYYQQFVQPDLKTSQEQDYLALENRLLSQGMLGSTGGALQMGELAKAHQASQRAAQAEAFQQSQAYYDTMRQQQLQDIAAAASIYESPQTLFQTGAGIGANIGGVMASYKPVYASMYQQSGGQSAFGGIANAFAGGMGSAAGAAMFGSDKRLKKNIKKLYKTKKGIQIYSWEWKKEAKDMGWDKYPTMGVIAQEVKETIPEAVVMDTNGYYLVDYNKVL